MRKYASAEERAAKNQKTTVRHFGFTEQWELAEGGLPLLVYNIDAAEAKHVSVGLAQARPNNSTAIKCKSVCYQIMLLSENRNRRVQHTPVATSHGNTVLQDTPPIPGVGQDLGQRTRSCL